MCKWFDNFLCLVVPCVLLFIAVLVALCASSLVIFKQKLSPLHLCQMQYFRFCFNRHLRAGSLIFYFLAGVLVPILGTAIVTYDGLPGG